MLVYTYSNTKGNKMKMKTWNAVVMIAGRGATQVTVNATNGRDAKLMLEAQYGTGNVRSLR